ncbi:hypothetical protein V9T40_012260 [Parthenolecanium corni]|uniref:Uncharacterized protein n=1 Tax=Parthenolecanium corni TaxID=536013 RepID=A0AAN9XZA6_9HEMI
MPLPNKFRVVESTFLLTLALLGSDIAHQFNIGMFRLHINSRRALVGCVICILNYAKTKTTTQLLCILRAFVDSEAAMLWMLGYIRKDDEICLCVYLGHSGFKNFQVPEQSRKPMSMSALQKFNDASQSFGSIDIWSLEPERNSLNDLLELMSRIWCIFTEALYPCWRLL